MYDIFFNYFFTVAETSQAAVVALHQTQDRHLNDRRKSVRNFSWRNLRQ